MVSIAEKKQLNFFELKILLSQHVILDSNWNLKDYKSPFSRLYFIKKGSGYIISGDKKIKIEAGNIYLIPAETTFSCGCEENETLEKIYFHITISTAEKYDILSKKCGVYCIKTSEINADDIYKIYSSSCYEDLLRLKEILYNTVYTFHKNFNFVATPIKEYSDTVGKIMYYIQKNSQNQLTVSDISTATHFSESRIRKSFKAETGISVGKYIDDLVFKRAEKLLIDNSLSIKDISDSLGFCDQFYFSRRFKERYHKTPSQYRKENFLY